MRKLGQMMIQVAALLANFVMLSNFEPVETSSALPGLVREM